MVSRVASLLASVLMLTPQIIIRNSNDPDNIQPPVVTCTTTISSGANLNTSISAMAAGGVLCLNAGTYATGTTLTGFTKSPSVTVRPVTTSTAVTITGLNFSGSVSGVTLDAYQGGAGTWFSMNTIDYSATGTKTNLIVRGVNASSTTGSFMSINGIVGDTSSVEHFTANNVKCSAAGGVDWRIIFDANGTASSQKLVLRFGTINGAGADGIRFGGSAGGTVEDTLFANVVEDPGTEATCHSDATQIYGGQNVIVRDSYYLDNVTGFAIYDGSVNVTLTNSIFDDGAHTRPTPVELYSVTTGLIEHNTLLHDSGCGSSGCAEIDLTHKPADDVTTGIVIKNNILTSINTDDATSITRTNNLIRTGATGAETSGTPTYTGGTSPTTVAGFALTSGSAGHAGASDGLDIGVAVSSVMASLGSRGGPLFARFGVTRPPPPTMRASLAAWKAYQAQKIGDDRSAHQWATTALRIAGIS